MTPTKLVPREKKNAKRESTLPEGWDHEADVVVLGFGGAGAAAAIEAHDRGSKAIILEKQPAARHTPSTKMCGGVVMLVNDVEKASKYLHQCTGGLTEENVSRAWAVEASSLLDWLKKLGFSGETKRFRAGGEVTTIPGADSVDPVLLQKTPGADKLWELLSTNVEKRGIEVLYETPADELITRRDESGRAEVIGVKARVCTEKHRGNGTPIFVKARKGVVLSTGGYEFDEELKKQFLPAYPLYYYGNPGNTGDGVRMAQKVGAALWHMNRMVGRAIGKFSEFDIGFTVYLPPAPYIIVDKHGRRFMNEDAQARLEHSVYYHLIQYDPETQDYPRMPCYWIFDDVRCKAGPLTLIDHGAVKVGIYDWSADNSEEIEKGWIIKSDSVEGLAKKIGIDFSLLRETVDEYNASCARGMDEEYGRSKENLVPLRSPPYYAVALWAGGPNTSGGPKRNAKAQIVDALGNTIPRLYGAGELGQTIGNLYPAAGGDVSDALCFGRIAGRNIASEEPWSN